MYLATLVLLAVSIANVKADIVITNQNNSSAIYSFVEGKNFYVGWCADSLNANRECLLENIEKYIRIDRETAFSHLDEEQADVLRMLAGRMEPHLEKLNSLYDKHSEVSEEMSRLRREIRRIQQRIAEIEYMLSQPILPEERKRLETELGSWKDVLPARQSSLNRQLELQTIYDGKIDEVQKTVKDLKDQHRQRKEDQEKAKNELLRALGSDRVWIYSNVSDAFFASAHRTLTKAHRSKDHLCWSNVTFNGVGQLGISIDGYLRSNAYIEFHSHLISTDRKWTWIDLHDLPKNFSLRDLHVTASLGEEKIECRMNSLSTVNVKVPKKRATRQSRTEYFAGLTTKDSAGRSCRSIGNILNETFRLIDLSAVRGPIGARYGEAFKQSRFAKHLEFKGLPALWVYDFSKREAMPMWIAEQNEFIPIPETEVSETTELAVICK